MLQKQKIVNFHGLLGTWYEINGRKTLPWRHTNDPYTVYISEIMLQQTQVKTVLTRYFTQFLTRFPTLLALANAPQDDILAAWQGLGYYNRAINLHKAAKQCAGNLPDSIETLIALPGIGRNTAHAVAAFAYRQPVAVMEANVRRVLARIFALQHPREEELWQLADLLLNRNNPFDYNQAMMDLGSLVCTKRAPNCKLCPASSICKGKLSPESYPQANIKRQVPVRKKIILLQRNEKGHYRATKRTGRFLGGLYHFTEIEPSAKRPADMTKLGDIQQQYSHFTLQAEVFLAKDESKSSTNRYSLAQLKKLPMSMAEQKILALLEA